MKNNQGGRGWLINFLPPKRGGSLVEGGGLFEKGRGLIEDLRYVRDAVRRNRDYGTEQELG